MSYPVLNPSAFPLPAEAEDIKVCPRCSAFIMKINDGSCNRMNCTVCGCLFCWLCLQEISDVHFLRSVWGCGLCWGLGVPLGVMGQWGPAGSHGHVLLGNRAFCCLECNWCLSLCVRCWPSLVLSLQPIWMHLLG